MKILNFESNEQKLDQTKEQLTEAVSAFVADAVFVNRPVRVLMIYESIDGQLGHVDFNLDGITACVAAQVVNRLAQQMISPRHT